MREEHEGKKKKKKKNNITMSTASNSDGDGGHPSWIHIERQQFGPRREQRLLRDPRHIWEVSDESMVVVPWIAALQMR